MLTWDTVHVLWDTVLVLLGYMSLFNRHMHTYIMVCLCVLFYDIYISSCIEFESAWMIALPRIRDICVFVGSSGRQSVIDQLQILSKFKLREDFFNSPNYVDSHPDALIHKQRIAIQISQSERLSTLVRTRVQQLRKLPIRLQPSRRLPTMVRMHA
jgi:hypothetical protein